MRGAIPPLPQYVFMAWCLVEHRDNFTFYLKQLELKDYTPLFYVVAIRREAADLKYLKAKNLMKSD
jgi:hypothetical protein